MSEPSGDRAIERLVRKLSEREAAALMLTALRAAPPLRVRATRCPTCGAGYESLSACATAVPLPDVDVLPPDAESDRTTLVMLGCEALTARSLILPSLVTARFEGRPGPVLRTRAARVSALTHPPDSHATLLTVLSQLDNDEQWADGDTLEGLDAGRDLRTGFTIPASTRLNDEAVRVAEGVGECMTDAHQKALRPHFLTTHPTGPVLAGLNELYLAHRADIVSTGMWSIRSTSPSMCGSPGG
jgi:hypothetical protein